MDLNFAELKKEAAATTEDIFGSAANAANKIVSHSHDLLGDVVGDGSGAGSAANVSSGAQDDNAHTEHYFANEQKNLDFGDPQAFVQRMSAGAKEAQEQLDAKFAQRADDFDDFLSKEKEKIHHGITDLTSDFMNAERGFFGAEKSAPISHASKPKVEDEKPSPVAHFEPSAPAKVNFYDEEEFLEKAPLAAFATPTVGNKDSDTDSPSVSYTPSPAKKPITAALKEQDNEQFISSEDLLSDLKEEPRTATPTVVPPPIAVSLVTDLDEEEEEEKEKPKAKPMAPKVEPPKPKPQPKQKEEEQQPKIVSVEEIFYKYGMDAWFKPERLHPKVESLIYWRDVKKSGIVFGAGLVTLVAISCFSVISVFAYLSLLTLFGTIAFRIYKSVTQAVQKTTDGHPFKEYLELDLTLSQEKVQDIAGIAVAHANGFTAELRRLFLVEDLIDSIKFGVILWVFTYIGAWFNGMTLVILAFVSLFTLPKVYENNKKSIDTYLDLVRSKLTEITDKIRVAIPIGQKKPVAAAAESEKDK